jgi:hypothetical protein
MEMQYQAPAQMRDGIQTNSMDNALDWEARNPPLETLPKLAETPVVSTRTAMYGNGEKMQDAFSMTMHSIVNKPISKILNHSLGNVKFKEGELILRTLTVEISQTWQKIIMSYRSQQQTTVAMFGNRKATEGLGPLKDLTSV